MHDVDGKMAAGKFGRGKMVARKIRREEISEMFEINPLAETILLKIN